MKRGKSLDLSAQIRRGVDEEPVLPIGADGYAGLRAGRDGSLPGGAAIGARTVPLRQAAACRRSKESNVNSAS